MARCTNLCLGTAASEPAGDFWSLPAAQVIDRLLDGNDMFRARVMLEFILNLRDGLTERGRVAWDKVLDWREYERGLQLKVEALEVEVPRSGTSAIVAARISGTQAHADTDTTSGHPATYLAVTGTAASSGMGNSSDQCTSTATTPALSYAGTYPLHLSRGFPTIIPQPDMCSQAAQIAGHYEAKHAALHDTMTTVVTKDSVIAKLQSRLDAAKGLKADLKDARAEVEKQRAAYLEEKKKKNVKLNGKMKAEKEEMAMRIERLEREVKRHEREDGNAEGEFAKLQLAMNDAMQKHFVVKRERRESAEAEKNQMK